MVESVSRANQSNIIYPERDGTPMSDNTK
ncbi:hypothetical protein CY0110_24701 [Crocosphaera chwakensis CCY0110]|uniref:Uncharacterized protein n=1 Tax=Crocosphaera chwakensis CCY0110 TaxID=391612 RepID=A3IMR6_9CHRO|nr:hypothetical protein CY0110_24701 [Crocosphaera chwakensis CCY0110]